MMKKIAFVSLAIILLSSLILINSSTARERNNTNNTSNCCEDGASSPCEICGGGSNCCEDGASSPCEICGGGSNCCEDGASSPCERCGGISRRSTIFVPGQFRGTKKTQGNIDLRIMLKGKKLREGNNLVYRAPDGLSLWARQRGGKVIGWSAKNRIGQPVKMRLFAGTDCWGCVLDRKGKCQKKIIFGGACPTFLMKRNRIGTMRPRRVKKRGQKQRRKTGIAKPAKLRVISPQRKPVSAQPRSTQKHRQKIGTTMPIQMKKQ